MYPSSDELRRDELRKEIDEAIARAERGERRTASPSESQPPPADDREEETHDAAG